MNKKKSVNNKALKGGETLEDQLTLSQKETWNNIKRGFEELKLAKEGKLKFRPIQKLINEL